MQLYVAYVYYILVSYQSYIETCTLNYSYWSIHILIKQVAIIFFL